MRRIAPLVLLTALGGCGYQTWSNPPFIVAGNPNAPAGNSETMRRVMGEPVHVKPLTPQAGQRLAGSAAAHAHAAGHGETDATCSRCPNSRSPGSPLSRWARRRPGSSRPRRRRSARAAVPPRPLARPGLPPPVVVTPVTPPSAAAPPPAREPGGQAVQTPSGPGVTAGGSSGYQTMTMPNGGSAIVIPNGNGTSTVIRSDGTIETIPTPKSK